MKYVWFNINTGTFSNSWNEEDHKKYVSAGMLQEAKDQNLKLIQFNCLTDENFEFFNLMKIVTNTDETKKNGKKKRKK